MKNETIKTYTEITPLDGLKLLVESDGKPIEGMAFKDDRGWFYLYLVGVNPSSSFPFLAGANWKHCAKVTEIDPCKAPDGCPELEPWMAYVGKGDIGICQNYGEIMSWSHGYATHCWVGRTDTRNASKDEHFIVDVRTEWAQEHFPEHCRIRNYQGPDAFEEFCEAWALDSLQYASPKWFKGMMKQAYELGVKAGKGER